MRIALDTNVLVSAVATRGLCADLLPVVLAEHQLVLGERVLAELHRVLQRTLRLPVTTIDELDRFLRQQGDVITAAPPVRLRDRDDLVVVAEAIAGKVDLLVSGDADLLEIASRAPIAIVAPRTCWEILRVEDSPE